MVCSAVFRGPTTTLPTDLARTRRRSRPSLSQLPALKFGVHYAPFAAVIPLSGSDVLDPLTRRFLARLDGLSMEQLLALAKRWRMEPGASRTLLQAVAKNRHVRSEEAVAIGALSLIPNQLTGDEGWSAVRTLVHGGRVLGT